MVTGDKAVVLAYGSLEVSVVKSTSLFCVTPASPLVTLLKKVPPPTAILTAGTKTPHRGQLINKDVYPPSSGAWRRKVKTAADPVSGEGLSGCLLLCPHLAEEAGKLSGVSFIKAQIPPRTVPGSGPPHSPEPPHPNSSQGSRGVLGAQEHSAQQTYRDGAHLQLCPGSTLLRFWFLLISFELPRIYFILLQTAENFFKK